MSTEDHKRSLSDAVNQADENEINWVDEDSEPLDRAYTASSSKKTLKQTKTTTNTIVMVETAFLASAASLVWLINYYFPLGPVLKVFFPIPIALIYLRRGNRASWMAAIVSGLLLLVLMGPTRSVIFLMPYGLMGVLLGACWQRKVSWLFSIGLGAVIGSLGIFFRFWLTSVLVGENLWIYAITQITQLLDWIFFKLGILAQPDFALIQTLAIGSIIVQNLVYLFAVHLVALMLLDRLNNPISRPPEWVRVLLDY
ncbi:MAG: DUF2232 domain-containing protein [Pleurocapsa sp.]